MKIAILSRGPNLYSTKRLHEAAVNRGHEAHVIDYLNCNIVIERGEASLVYQGEKIHGIDAMIPRIGASKTMYGSAIIRQFEMMDVFCACSSQALARSRDKLRSMQIMSRHGVGMPKTAFAHAPTEIKALIEAVGGPPLIIKLLEGTQGKGVVLAETYKAAKSALDAFYGLKANMLVQEFIAEAKSTDIRAFVVNGKVVGAMKRTGNAEDFRSNLHQGGKPEPLQKIPRDIRSTAVNAANAMGLKIAGVDILPSDRGPLVMEVNSSPGLEGIEKATEKDIAGMIIQYLEDNAHKKHKKDKVGV